MVQKVFADLSPYPALVFPAIPKHSTSTMKPFPAMVTNYSTLSNPFLNPRHASPLKPISLPHIQDPNPQPAYISPPSTPDRHPPCQLDTMNLVSSTPPPVPAGVVNDLVGIAEPNNNSLELLIVKPQESHMEVAILKEKIYTFKTPSA